MSKQQRVKDDNKREMRTEKERKQEKRDMEKDTQTCKNKERVTD